MDRPIATKPDQPITQPGTVSERRDSDRHVRIFRVGKITHEGGENLCIVRNISSGGAMVQAFDDLQVDKQISLDLRVEEKITARVVWVREQQVGLAFSEKIDPGYVLRSEQGSGRRRRPPRVSVEASARLQVGDTYHPVVIANISQSGSCLTCDLPLAPATEVRLWIEGLGPQQSFVQWIKDGKVGLAFCRPVSIWELTKWVRDQALLVARDDQPNPEDIPMP